MVASIGSDNAEKLFEEPTPLKFDINGAIVENSYRSRLNLPLFYPTNSQSEILIRGIVDPKYIMSIIVRTNSDKEKVQEVISPEFYEKIRIEPRFFSKGEGRKDWR